MQGLLLALSTSILSHTLAWCHSLSNPDNVQFGVDTQKPQTWEETWGLLKSVPPDLKLHVYPVHPYSPMLPVPNVQQVLNNNLLDEYTMSRQVSK